MLNFLKRQDPFVSCSTCKHLVRVEDAQCVTLRALNNRVYVKYYYCPEHRKPYDFIREGSRISYSGFYKTDIEVTEYGQPKGYIAEAAYGSSQTRLKEVIEQRDVCLEHIEKLENAIQTAVKRTSDLENELAEKRVYRS